MTDANYHADKPKEYDPRFCLTESGALLAEHEIEVFKRGAEFLWYAHCSAANLIGSGTTRGYLSSYRDGHTGRIEHEWYYDN